MKKIEGYNRNLVSGKRPHKKIQRFGKYKTLSERCLAEADAIDKYKKRVGQYKRGLVSEKFDQLHKLSQSYSLIFNK